MMIAVVCSTSLSEKVCAHACMQAFAYTRPYHMCVIIIYHMCVCKHVHTHVHIPLRFWLRWLFCQLGGRKGGGGGKPAARSLFWEGVAAAAATERVTVTLEEEAAAGLLGVVAALATPATMLGLSVLIMLLSVHSSDLVLIMFSINQSIFTLEPSNSDNKCYQYIVLI